MRVLQIVDSMDLGGIQAFIMNVYREIIKKGIQFDFLLFREKEQFFEKEILSLGGKIYKVPGRRDGIIKSRLALKRFYNEHKEYTVVHYHTSSLSYIQPLVEAKKANIPVRIVHSHSTKAPGNRIHNYLHYFNKSRIHKYANQFLACGELSAKWMYSHTKCEDSCVIIHNGIDIDDFAFDADIRKQIRTQLAIDSYYVIGHIGRFSPVKNHKFLIDVFVEYIKRFPKEEACLLLIGDGELKEKMINYSKMLGVSKKIFFLGARNDVNVLLQAIDVFVMPSKYEGFPVTAIEAQASGVPCIVSNTITPEVKIKKNVRMLGLFDDVDLWTEAINDKLPRIIDNTQLKEGGYDMKDVVNYVERLYSLGSTD